MKIDYLELAEQALHGSERHKWVACIVASHCVGSYENGWAQSLAERMGYSDVSRVYDLADAGKARRALRPYIKEFSHFRISVFTYCWKVIQAGHQPHLIALVMKEILEEVPRPKMKDVTDLLAGTFEMPQREPTPEAMLRLLDRLVSWYASNGDHAHRKEWDEHTSGLRRILKVLV